MIFEEFKRLFYSKKTIPIIFMLTFTAVISYIFFYKEYSDLSSLLKSGAEDVNLDIVRNIATDTRSFQFIFNFIFKSEMFHIYFFVLMLYLGVFLSSEHLVRLKNGYGNLVQTRSNYRRHFNTLFLAQSIYIAAIVFISMLMLTGISIIINNFEFGIGIVGEKRLEFWESAGVIIIEFILIVAISVLVNLISSSLTFKIRNLKVIQSIPLVFFGFLPIILGSTLGNLNGYFGTVFNVLIPFNTLNYILQYYNGNTSFIPFIYIGILLLLSVFMYIVNNKKFSKEYI